MVVLRTLGAPQRRMLGRRKARAVESGETEPVPTSRATIIDAEPLDSPEAGERWVEMPDDERHDAIAAATRELNLVLRAHRAAAADPYPRDIGPEHTLVVRIGYGDGDQVADGRYERAIELPREPLKRKRSEALAPQERLAAILGGRAPLLAGEELLLRAQLDVDVGRMREAALQSRIALEALLGELEEKFAAPLRPLRDQVGRAANAALDGDLSEEDEAAVRTAVDQMAVAARRSGTAAGAG